VIALQNVLLRGAGDPGAKTLESYRSRGGYGTLERVLRTSTPEQVTAEVTRSGLRGRGGAGFPTGRKWSFVPKNTGKPVYLCVNGDESEPGTFKDRQILEWDPHLLLEGSLLTCYAIGARVGYLYLRCEFAQGIRTLHGALREAYAAGLVGRSILGTGFDCDLVVHVGAGAYICGEETGLLNSLEGRRPYPRIKPPFPAVEGLFQCPTIVNNVETIATVVPILERGADWFRGMGTEKDPGLRLYCVSGAVRRPGVFEAAIGFPLRSLLDGPCGGPLAGRKFKAVLPGGSSSAYLTADELDVAMDSESLAKAKTMMGSAGVIVLDDRHCLVEATWNLARFYAHESCGQCTPCREGIHWVEKVLRRIEHGGRRPEDLPLLDDLVENIGGRTVCALADGAVMPIGSALRKFRSEFEAHEPGRPCPVRAVREIAGAGAVGR
jgi:NADH-quinone oxidoreductase subunit F